MLKSDTFLLRLAVLAGRSLRCRRGLEQRRQLSAPAPALQPLHLDELGALVQRLRGEAPEKAVEAMEGALETFRQEQADRAALMKRDWSDTAFEEGEAGNDAILEQFERELVSVLQRSKAGLADAEVLGSAIDLAGAPETFTFIILGTDPDTCQSCISTLSSRQGGEGQPRQRWQTTAASSSSAAIRPISVRPLPPSTEPKTPPLSFYTGAGMSADDALPGQIADEAIMQNETLANVTLDKLDDSVKNWLNDQNTQTLNGALAFVPFILQQAFFEGNLDEKQIVIHKGSGGVVFSDASGFTALTEKLAKKSNGAELLSQCLTAFFTPLIDLINAYRGDTIKTIYFPSVDDTKTSSFNGIVPPHGSFGLADLGPMATAVLRASACCIEIHKRLHMFETGVDDVRLCLHIGVGCGEISILQVGGIVPPETHIPRIEYLISGAPLEQISIV
eukprot:s1620_g2.t1